MNDIDKDWPNNLPAFRKTPLDKSFDERLVEYAYSYRDGYNRGFREGYERRHMEVLAALA